MELRANVNLADVEGVSPLFVAASRGNTELAKLLISASAALNAQTIEGETPLKAAVRAGHRKVIQILVY